MKLKGFSIQWKVTAIAILGPMVIAGILAVQRVADIRRGAEEAILSKSRAVVATAEATRENIAQKLQKGVLKPLEELQTDKEKILEVVPIVTAMRVAAQNADKIGLSLPGTQNRPPQPWQSAGCHGIECSQRVDRKTCE